MPDGKAALVKLLADAHSNELALINVLEAHRRIAEPGTYRQLLDHHLEETRGHAQRVGRRLNQLGFSRSLFAAGYGAAQNVVKQTMVLAKGPVDMIRGGGNPQEKMLRNAIDELTTEAQEIATYDAIETVARGLGDNTTAELAAAIRLDEEQMFDSLRKQISGLGDGFVHTVVTGRPPVAAPWADYDELTVDEIQDRLRDATPALTRKVREYESENKNRTTVIKATGSA